MYHGSRTKHRKGTWLIASFINLNNINFLQMTMIIWDYKETFHSNSIIKSQMWNNVQLIIPTTVESENEIYIHYIKLIERTLFSMDFILLSAANQLSWSCMSPVGCSFVLGGLGRVRRLHCYSALACQCVSHITFYFKVSVFTPVLSPWVSHNPVVQSIFFTITNHHHTVV